MEKNLLRVAYILDKVEGNPELRIPADSIQQRNGWVFAICNNQIVGGVKEEYLKGFYLEVDTSKDFLKEL